MLKTFSLLALWLGTKKSTFGFDKCKLRVRYFTPREKSTCTLKRVRLVTPIVYLFILRLSSLNIPTRDNFKVKKRVRKMANRFKLVEALIPIRSRLQTNGDSVSHCPTVSWWKKWLIFTESPQWGVMKLVRRFTVWLFWVILTHFCSLSRFSFSYSLRFLARYKSVSHWVMC